MRSGARYLIAAFVIGLQARSLDAQQLRGTVRDSTAGAPLPGAVVSVIDSSGATGARTIADGLGRFTLSLAPRGARVRVIRIGYQPRDLTVPPGPSPFLELAMVRLPAVLNAVRVSGEELCPGSVDRGPAFQLWEQARAGLLATVVAREANPSMTTSLVFKRQVSYSDELVMHQETKVGTGRTTRPFLAAASSAEFAATGYMREDFPGGGRTFFAPDADVLLDESFATSHCFHLQVADNAHPGQIGLAFTPARNRETVVDVRGVIWMDRAAPAVRSLDFRYTELEPVSVAAGAGGHIEFREVENGVAFIERWVLRMPLPTPIRAATTFVRPGSPAAVRRQDRVDLRVAAIGETGGMVLAAKWADGTSWQMPPSGVAGGVMQSGSAAPSPHAIVTLAGTADTVTTDEHGAFTLTPVLPGRYTLSVSDTTLLSYAVPRKSTRAIEIGRDRVTQVRLEVAPIATVLSDICAGQRVRRATTTIVGRIVLPDTLATRNAAVRATWQADYNGGAPVSDAGGQITINLAEQTSDVDGQGRFIVCGAAINRPIRLHFTQSSVFADTTVVAGESSLTSIEWRPQVLTADGSDAGATLTGAVSTAATNAPAAGAEVSLSPVGRSVVTGADGVFQFSNLPAGNYRVQVRRIGDAVIIDSVRLEAGGRLRRAYSLVRATQLDTVRSVAAERQFISPALRAFEDRRRVGIGTFINDSVLRKNDDSRLSDLLRLRAPGIRVLAGPSATYAASARDSRSGKYVFSSGGSACYVTVYLDGLRLFDNENRSQMTPPPNLNDFSINQLGAVEFYAGGATVPVQFKSSECGVLLLWTREKH